MKYYIEGEIIDQNFKLILTEIDIHYKLYSTNSQMDNFYRYAKFYDFSVIKIKEMRSYRISKQSIKDIKIDKEFFGFNSLDQIMIFDFPDDYPEEDLFYFVMKFNAKKIH